jgi:hypothetical protein
MLNHSRRPTLHVVSGEEIGEGQSATVGATKWDIVKTRLQERFGAALNRRRVAGFVQPISYQDLVTGDLIEIRVSALFTTLSINGRDYYFKRLTGRFDGTGQGCR